MSAVPRPPLLPLIPEGIPQSMHADKRWAPWKAVWNPAGRKGQGKYEKVPHRADKPGSGLSNKSPRGWSTFDEAVQACIDNPDKFAGIGYLLTGEHEAGAPSTVFKPGKLMGVDLDHCRDPQTGEIAEWATELLTSFASYTEVSPSGTGLRAILEYKLPQDCMDHVAGVELYGGARARFVTLTGQHVAGTPRAVRVPPVGAVDAVVAKYGKAPSRAEVEDLHLPALLSDMELPDLSELDLPPHASNFLAEGPEPGADRSNAMFATAIALTQAGCTREQIFTIFEANEHAIEIALDHRKQYYDKALRYIWKDHCCNGAARAKELALDLHDTFNDERSLDEIVAALAAEPTLEDLLGGEPEVAAPAEGQVSDAYGDFDNLDALDGTQLAAPASRDLAPVKVPRFTPIMPDAFLRRTPPKWLVKGVVPQAGLAVIYGASGSGKTFFTFDLCASIVRGAPWRGMPVVEGRGVYVVAEGAGGFRNRLEAYCQSHDVDPSAFGMGVIADAPNLMDKAQVKELLDALKAFGPVSFVVVDTYARAMVGGNENDSKDAGLVIAHCGRIHKATGALVILVHHSGKEPGSGARGSSALRAAADLEIEVTGGAKSRAATITKMKDGEDGKQYGFRLGEVVLGEDEDGFPITSCVIEHIDGPVQRDRHVKPLTPAQQLVLRVLDDAMDLAGAGLAYSELKRLVVDQIPVDPDKKKDNRHRDIGKAIDTLVSLGHLSTTPAGALIRAENNE